MQDQDMVRGWLMGQAFSLEKQAAKAEARAFKLRAEAERFRAAAEELRAPAADALPVVEVQMVLEDRVQTQALLGVM